MTVYDPSASAPADPIRVGRPVTNTEPTLGELFSQLASDMSSLMHQEIELARAETQAKVAQALRSLVTLIAGGLVAYAGVILLLIALAVWLSNYMTTWLAVLIVGAIVLIVGAVMISIGRSALANLTIVPENTIESIKQDARWAKEQIQ
jgi:type IV secretory pathway TrbL component